MRAFSYVASTARPHQRPLGRAPATSPRASSSVSVGGSWFAAGGCARSEQGGLSSAAESGRRGGGETLGSFQYGWDRRCFLMASSPRPRARSQLRKPVRPPPRQARTHARTLPHSPHRRDRSLPARTLAREFAARRAKCRKGKIVRL